MKLNKFIPLTKMEEQGDGTLHVFGTVTAEQPDLDNEVCDYEGTKPFYAAKVTAMFKLTSAVEGMEPSIMPMREMHDLKAIGAGRSIEFDDAAKTIRMGFNVVEPTAILKFKKGVLIGFSQGGDYVGERIPDPVHAGCKRYVADPAEVSAVDSPCLPSALVESMKGRTVTLMKSGGVTEEIPLMVKSVDSVFAERFLSSEKCIRAMLASNDWDAAARKTILTAAEKLAIKPADRDQKAIKRACAKISLEKGLYEVGWLGDMIEQLHWLCLQTEFERDMEDDGSKVPEGLRAAWLKLIAEFKEMAIEEADEIAAAGGEKGEKGMKITDQAGLTKAAKTIHDHLEKLSEMHKTHGEHMKKAHEAIQDKHEALGEHIEKCMKAAKDAAEGEEPKEGKKEEKAAPANDLNKALEAKVDGLEKSIKDLTDKLAATPANTLAHTGVLSVDKSIKADADFEKLLQ